MTDKVEILKDLLGTIRNRTCTPFERYPSHDACIALITVIGSILDGGKAVLQDFELRELKNYFEPSHEIWNHIKPYTPTLYTGRGEL